MNKLKIISISQNDNGDWYVIYKIPNVARGLHGKSKGHVDEVLILGIPKAKFPAWCEQNGITVKKVEDIK